MSCVLALLVSAGALLGVPSSAAAEPVEIVSTIGYLPTTTFLPVMEESGGKLYVIGGFPTDPMGMVPSLATV